MIVKRSGRFLAAGLTCSLVLVLSSCKKPITPNTVSSWTTKDIEARLYDVPFFVQAQVGDGSQMPTEGSPTLVTLLVDASLDQVIAFYKREMEWFGWECRAQVANENEALLSFEKPHKFCTISLRRLANQKTKVVIGTGIKDSSEQEGQ
jgi:hypothetical protein